MPSVPGVKGQPSPARITMPAPENDPEIIGSQATPEPAIKVEDFKPPTQEALAERSVATQNVKVRGEQVPSTSGPEGEKPAYHFTDEDRAAASRARWNKFDWEGTPLDDALARLAELRAEVEKGGVILQNRVSSLKVEKVKCYGCDNMIDLASGRWVTYRTRNNFETGIPESAYACSAACGLKLNREFLHPVRQPSLKQ